MIDHNLLKNAKKALRKEAFNPMTEEAQMAAAQQGAAPPPAGGGAPPMDPAMMAAGGGAPPMDPAMMGGGAPPMDPAMMGMDPAMMGGDPAAMGMDPAAMGMDPAMMGGDPAMMEDPAAGGTPITLTLEDLQQVVKEMTGEGGEAEGESKRATNKQIMEELSLVKEQLSAIAAAQGIQLPAGSVGAGGDTSTEPTMAEPEDIDTAAAELAAAGATDDALAGNPAFDALGAGLPPGEAIPKAAGIDWAETKLG